eukprot:5127529-Prymnesium_polylepis.2
MVKPADGAVCEVWRAVRHRASQHVGAATADSTAAARAGPAARAEATGGANTGLKPQSVQSEPYAHTMFCDPEPPSSQIPSVGLRALETSRPAAPTFESSPHTRLRIVPHREPSGGGYGGGRLRGPACRRPGEGGRWRCERCGHKLFPCGTSHFGPTSRVVLHGLLCLIDSGRHRSHPKKQQDEGCGASTASTRAAVA